jgi:hypothetical protein
MAIFTHTPRKSDHVKQFRYDDHSKVLAVTFEHERTNGPQTYLHKIPLVVFNAYLKWCKDGFSPGEYYHRYIKRYPRVTA